MYRLRVRFHMASRNAKMQAEFHPWNSATPAMAPYNRRQGGNTRTQNRDKGTDTGW